MLILLCLALMHPILGANVVSKTYDWSTSGNTHYQVDASVNSPQVDSPFNATLKLTLTAKDASLNQTTAQWMQITLLSSEKPIHMESEKQKPNQTLVLSTIGDSWQETFTFQISSSEHGISKGQNIEIYLIYKISINQTTTQQSTSNYVGDNTNDPLKFNLSIPLLTFQELIITVMVLLAIVIIIPQYIYWKRKERKMKESEKPADEAAEEREEEGLKH